MLTTTAASNSTAMKIAAPRFPSRPAIQVERNAMPPHIGTAVASTQWGYRATCAAISSGVC